MKIITEMSYDFELHEDSKTKDMFAVGIFSSAELKNNNKRVYKKDLLEREVKKVQEKIEKKCLWGELGHPPNPEVNPDKIAIRTTQLEWRGNDLYGKAKILDTPMGQIARTLVKEGQMGISSRGLGTVGDDGNVNEDFHLITWDLVTDPSNNPSWVNGIYEGQTFALPGMANIQIKEPDIKTAQQAYFKHLLNTIDIIGEGLNKPIKVYSNKEYGIEAHVFAVWGKENMEGYGVKLKDTDANKYIEVKKVFPNEKDANDYAKLLVKKY
jgi:hypothetical protein